MGDIADMMLDGTLCCICGIYLGAEGLAMCKDCFRHKENREAWPMIKSGSIS